MGKQFGGKLNKETLERYAASRHWDGKKFVNLETTTMNISFQTLPKLLYKQFCEKEGRAPNTNLPILPLDRKAFLQAGPQTTFAWQGHSSVLMRMNNKTLLIDPMLGPNAAPISPFPVKRFSADTLELIDDFPEIDLLLLTHDHYDHLDYESIQRLKAKVKHYYVALGLARHLQAWGIENSLITEFDWWQSKSIDGINISFTPTRHFSGRGLRDRAKSLWGGWVFVTNTERIWFSGDGGYGAHFKAIGRRLGPFDFAFMECGQYNENWHQIHMYPEESVQAGIDATAKILMPVHWGAFSLAQHSWTDPAERFAASCLQQQIPLVIPEIGQVVGIKEIPTVKNWWRQGV